MRPQAAGGPGGRQPESPSPGLAPPPGPPSPMLLAVCHHLLPPSPSGAFSPAVPELRPRSESCRAFHSLCAHRAAADCVGLGPAGPAHSRCLSARAVPAAGQLPGPETEHSEPLLPEGLWEGGLGQEPPHPGLPERAAQGSPRAPKHTESAGDAAERPPQCPGGGWPVQLGRGPRGLPARDKDRAVIGLSPQILGGFWRV